MKANKLVTLINICPLLTGGMFALLLYVKFHFERNRGFMITCQFSNIIQSTSPFYPNFINKPFLFVISLSTIRIIADSSTRIHL